MAIKRRSPSCWTTARSSPRTLFSILEIVASNGGYPVPFLNVRAIGHSAIAQGHGFDKGYPHDPAANDIRRHGCQGGHEKQCAQQRNHGSASTTGEPAAKFVTQFPSAHVRPIRASQPIAAQRTSPGWMRNATGTATTVVSQKVFAIRSMCSCALGANRTPASSVRRTAASARIGDKADCRSRSHLPR